MDTIKAWYNGALLIYVGHTNYIKKANEVKGNEMNSQNLVVCVDNSSKKSSAPYKMGGYKICIINYGDTQYNTSFITFQPIKINTNKKFEVFQYATFLSLLTSFLEFIDYEEIKSYKMFKFSMLYLSYFLHRIS